MANERITENIVRDILRDLRYYQDSSILIEEQKSDVEEIKKILKTASKTGKGGRGAPEFIISSSKIPDFIIIFECKGSSRYHETPDGNNPKDYAVDGVLHYAKKLCKSYNVIAIAISGDSKSSLKISNFIHPKESKSPKELRNKSGQIIDDIISFEDYIKHGTYDFDVANKRQDDLMSLSLELHGFMREYGLTESEKPLLVSGTLIALRNIAFSKSFDAYTPEDLQKQWMRVIKEEMIKADIPHSKEYSMTQPYTSIAVHPELGKSRKKFPKGVLFELIKMLNDKVWPFISVYNDFDVVGQFYGEFLKYTGGDKKALGIVLTPRHITELFSLLANTQKDSRILDICAGTGAFLISAMHHMFKQAFTEQEKENIKQNGLIGVEQQPNMYALAASNMILRGDGKANLYQGSCFSDTITSSIKNHKANIGMLNPPYAQKDEDLHELVFVKHMLDCLVDGAIGIAIIPMSCAITFHPLREEILKYHTLDAVMSMPDDLFYPVGVVTCITVFIAHKPHKQSNRKTWFGYWKNDGFVKTKHKGRIDQNELWGIIRDRWVQAYRNRDDVPGESMKYNVDHNDEWCAEAYMVTDYSVVSKADYEKAIKQFLIFKLLNQTIEGELEWNQ